MDTLMYGIGLLVVSSIARKLILNEIKKYGGNKHTTYRMHLQPHKPLTILKWGIIYTLSIPAVILWRLGHSTRN